MTPLQGKQLLMLLILSFHLLLPSWQKPQRPPLLMKAPKSARQSAAGVVLLALPRSPRQKPSRQLETQVRLKLTQKPQQSSQLANPKEEAGSKNSYITEASLMQHLTRKSLVKPRMKLAMKLVEKLMRKLLQQPGWTWLGRRLQGMAAD